MSTSYIRIPNLRQHPDAGMLRMLSPHVTFRRVQLDAGACWPDAADAGGNLIRDADEGSGRMQGRMLDADTLWLTP